ncbi:hypothetical protein H0R92_08570 [Treponema sp. OMZ 840]|uniref:hypothetical protein n=1 Tax=Treponema sp. OMZ 840 TaxID=244313 RepID=UPI003D8B999F
MSMRKFIFAAFFCFFAVCVYAQTQELEKALAAKDVSAVRSLLTAASQKEKLKLENAAFNGAKQAVRDNDLEFAQALTEAILFSNPDHREAQDLYTSIKEMLRSQQLVADRKQREREEADSKARAEAEKKAQEERAAKRLADSEALYKSVHEVDLRNFSADVFLGPTLNLFGSGGGNLYFNSKKAYSSAGLVSGFSAQFTHPYILIKLGMKFSWLTVPVSTQDLSWILSTRLGIGTAAAGVPLFLSAGYTELRYYSKGGGPAVSMFYNRIQTPIIGFGAENWEVYKNLDVSFRFDWLPVSVVTRFMDFGMDFNAGARYKFWSTDIVSVYAGVDLDTYIFAVKSDFGKGYADWNIVPAVYVAAVFRGQAPK